MKRSAVFAAVALLALAACSSGKGSGGALPKSTSSGASVPTTTTKKAAKAYAITKRLGCTNAKQTAIGSRFGLPRPIASLTCAANGISYRVELYVNHVERERLFSAASTTIRCRLLKALGLKGPIYTVNGDDYSATATGAPGAAAAQAKALGVKLGLPVTTTDCPK